MLNSTDEERDTIVGYFLSQSPDATVSFSQKVYAETIAGHRHEVWDLHASDGRWWIVTNPTNLYSQEQFPNMDLVVTFHMGLCLRIPRTNKVPVNDPDLLPFTGVLKQHDEVEATLHQANNLLGYRAVGLGCRETLISFIQSMQGAKEWPDNELKKSDVKGWASLILSETLSSSYNEKRRRLFRTTINETWDFSNWLTHTNSATWHDAETAYLQVGHILNLTISVLIRHLRNVPDECPECKSPHISPENGYQPSTPEIEWQRPTCDACDWTGEAIPLRELSTAELIVREGETSDSCSIMKNPLVGLKKPNEN